MRLQGAKPMGQKVSPISQRLSINKIADSRWIAGKKDYAALLEEDVKIRKFVEKKLKKAGLAKVVIERFAKKSRGYDSHLAPGHDYRQERRRY